VQPLLAFVTTGFYSGAAIGGLAGADSICASEADDGGANGTFRAWISNSSTSAAARLNHVARPYVLADGTIVAKDWTDLTDGTLAAAIARNADGTAAPLGGAWTATDASGAISYPSNTCNDWTSNSGQGADGYVGAANSDWTLNSVQPLDSCSVQSRLYCLQQ
jgi:hypothetical protein